jgi:hypothetical protein
MNFLFLLFQAHVFLKAPACPVTTPPQARFHNQKAQLFSFLIIVNYLGSCPANQVCCIKGSGAIYRLCANGRADA